MTLPPLATVDDLELRLGSTIDDTDQAEALLRYASALIRSFCHETWVNDDAELEDVPSGVLEVCVEMVYRSLQNPGGVTQDTAGPFSVSFGSDAAQRIYLTKSDKIILRPPNNAFTVDPTPADATDFSEPDWAWTETA